MTNVSSGGAQSLGAARGSIQIDTSDLQRIQALTQQVGQVVARNLGQIDAGAQKAQQSISDTASALGRLGGVLGIGTGIGLAVTLGRLAIESDSIATSYNRQSVAAVNLAGSQAKLNDLLDAYDKVTGGAIDKATALADVTHMQALGFADNADELEKFITAARGISIAMGRSQDYVIQQLNLSIANQSTMRLDQIGLSAAEVKKRIDELKAANGGLTQEQAYQNAVLGIAIEKYGSLVASAAAQATGAEKAAKAWKDFKLELGEALGPVTGGVLTGLSDELIGISNYIKGVESDAKDAKKALDDMRKAQPNSPVSQAGGAVGSFLAFDPVKWIEDQISNQFSPSGQLLGQIRGLQNIRSGLTAGRADIVSGIANGTATEADLQRQDALIKQVNDDLAQLSARLRGSAALMGDRNDITRVTPAGPPSAGGRTLDQTKAIVAWQQNVQEIESKANEARVEETRQYESQRTQVISQYETTIARDAEDFGRQRARENQQLEKQLADIQAEQGIRELQAARDLADNIAAETEASNQHIADMQRQSARNIEKINESEAKNIAKINADRDKNIAKIEADSGKDITKITQDSNDNLAKINEDYAKARERALQQHNDTLFTAAGELDAKAVAAEQRRYAEEQQNAADDHATQLKQAQDDTAKRVQEAKDAEAERIQAEKDSAAERIKNEQDSAAERIRAEQESLAESIAQERASLAQRISEEKAAQDKQLQDARMADLQRASDLKASLKEQQDQEDADHALRLQRMAEDNARQLAELDTQHAQRLTQIDEQQQKERDKLDDEFAKQLDQLGIHNDAWLKLQKKGQDDAEAAFDKWWSGLTAKVNQKLKQFAPTSDDPAKFFSGFQTWIEEFSKYFQAKQQNPIGPGFADGGPVTHTGYALVHSGEYVLSRAMLATAAQTAIGGNRSTSVSIGDIIIHALPGQNAGDIASAVKTEIMNIFKGLE